MRISAPLTQCDLAFSATARMLLPSIIPGQFVVTMKENVTDLPSLLDM